MYIDKLDDAVNKCSNANRRTIKMNPVDVKPNIHIDFNKENNKGYPKFNVDDNLKISKYKDDFAKGYIKNLSEEVFVIRKYCAVNICY